MTLISIRGMFYLFLFYDIVYNYLVVKTFDKLKDWTIINFFANYFHTLVILQIL